VKVGFDWPWLNWYFVHFSRHGSPFGHSRGFDIKTANASAVLVIAFALAASIAIWVIAAMTGAI